MSGSSSSSIHALLKKTEHYDKDERYMATSDLCEILKRHALAASANVSQSMASASSVAGYQSGYQHQMLRSQMLDANTEKRICTAVLKLLDDSSNDVQAIAVKTLGVLLTTVHEDQVVEIAVRLVSLVLDSSKSQLRDVYAIGLRTLVKTVPLQMGDHVSHRLIGRLIDGIRCNSTSGESTALSQDENKTAEEISLASLEVLTDLLTRFGALPYITRQHEQILQVTLSQLASESHVVRKRAGNSIGCLSVVISDQLLFRLVESLLSQIDLAEGLGKSGKRRARRDQSSDSAKGISKDWKVADTRALIRTMCTVSGAVGHRLGQEQIDRIVPIFLRFCDPDDAIAGDDDNYDDNDEMGEDEKVDDENNEAAVALANELRESCFAGFQSFVLRCPVQIEPHLPQIVQAALAYMRYDPNYSYGDEQDEDEEGAYVEEDAESDDEEDDYEEEDDYDDFDDGSDDDDDSWKVRRSAIRTLSSVVEFSKRDLSKLWINEYSWKKNKKRKTTVAGALVARFKEREENCRVDIIDCFTRLLSATVTAASAGEVVLFSPDAMDTSGDGDKLVIDLRSKFVPATMKACEKQLGVKKGGARTKSSSLALLSTLCIAPGGIGGAENIISVFNHVKTILSIEAGSGDGSGNSKSLKLDALCLVRIIIACGQHESSHVKSALLNILLSVLCKSVEEHWYKVIAETLRVLAEIPRLLLLGKTEQKEMNFVANALHDAIKPRLEAHDLDQEIKECALAASASLLSILHESLTPKQKSDLLTLLLERLKNETTRIAAIKTISAIAMEGSDIKTKLDLSPILPEVLAELSALLRQNSRGVKQSALECLDVVVRGHGQDNVSNLNDDLFDLVLKELGAIIIDSDLHISHLSLRASISVLQVCPSCSSSIEEYLLPPSLALSTSPLLQDLALDSLLALLEQLVESNAIKFEILFADLQDRLADTTEKGVHHGGSKQAVGNLAKCIAAITATASELERVKVVSDLLSLLETADYSQCSQKVQLALRTSGDLGRVIDLSNMNGVVERLQKIYVSSFDASSEDIKHAAAYGLGRASVGAMPVFLPAILQSLEKNNQKKQYLLLSAIRELIHCHQLGAGSDISPYVQQILPHLEFHCSDKEEGVRTMVAECLGSLICLRPDSVLPQLKRLVTEHSGNVESTGDVETESFKNDALICSTVATSVKFAIAGNVNSSALSQFMPEFLALLRELDLNVRSTALLMVYSAVHHNPQLVTSFMQEDILPSLYELAKLKMQRKVDLGPFKHTVDDALSLRKTAISIFATCLEKCPSSLDIPAFMPVLTQALSDVEDVQLQAHQIVISMCIRHPLSIVSSIETFVEPLSKTVHKKMGSKKGTELERAQEWIKSALRAMVTLSRVDGAMNCQKYAEFVDMVRNNAQFQPMLQALDEEI